MSPTQTQVLLFQKVKDEREKNEPFQGPSVAELIPNITDRLDEEYDELWEAATEFCYEPIPLGSTAKALYRLKPDFYGLIPHRDETALSTHSARLGVNTNLPTSRRQQHLSETSQDSAESDDMGDHGGFIFQQLGELMSWLFLKESGCPPGDDSQILLDSDCWMGTGFFVVARLSSNGYAQRLYLIMDSFPRLDSGGRKAIEFERWGYLPFDELK
ncbi:hypothetical protein IWX90DRAFT_479399 [Phyllosticta citrichinensis]|uniref:Uncharacterized protein n=1 Tax=Phyllosticta citrichinensis TaxID=1130410 RepID=A0ABR1XN57_9PEZI